MLNQLKQCMINFMNRSNNKTDMDEVVTGCCNERIAIINGFRTPFCKAGTHFKKLTADDLAIHPLKEVITRSAINETDIDEVITGCCAQPAHAANISRVISLRAGLPKDVPAVTVHRNCASGMEAISTAAQRLRLGEATVIAAVGVESMSNIPLLYNQKMVDFFNQLTKAKTRIQKLSVIASFRLGHLSPVIALKLGLTDPVCNLMMGNTAENIAKMFSIPRKTQDEFSLQSHVKALQAQQNHVFDDEILPIQLPDAYNETIVLDNGPRPGQTIEALEKLPPYFDRSLGTVTVGSSSQVTDGASACILMRERTAKDRGLEPLGYLRAYAYSGCDPTVMGLGPVYASHRLLRSLNMSMSDIDLVEMNEAFAAQVLGNLAAFESKEFHKKELNDDVPLGTIDMSQLNVNGGAIALGHPLGASGMRIVLTALYELHRRDSQRALATLCVGGGQGGACILERT